MIFFRNTTFCSVCWLTSWVGRLAPKRGIQRPLSLVFVPVSAVVAVMVVVMVMCSLLTRFLQGVVPKVNLLGPLWSYSGNRASHRASITTRLKEKRKKRMRITSYTSYFGGTTYFITSLHFQLLLPLFCIFWWSAYILHIHDGRHAKYFAPAKHPSCACFVDQLCDCSQVCTSFHTLKPF